MLSGAESRKKPQTFSFFFDREGDNSEEKKVSASKREIVLFIQFSDSSTAGRVSTSKKKGKLFPTTFPLPPVGYYCDTAGRQPVALEYGWWEAQLHMFGFNILENLFSLYARLRNWMFSNSTRNLQIRTAAEIHSVLCKI